VRLRWLNASVAPCPGAEDQPGKAILTFEAPAEQYRTADAMRRLEQLAIELQHSNELVERKERATARSGRFLSKVRVRDVSSVAHCRSLCPLGAGRPAAGLRRVRQHRL